MKFLMIAVVAMGVAAESKAGPFKRLRARNQGGCSQSYSQSSYSHQSTFSQQSSCQSCTQPVQFQQPVQVQGCTNCVSSSSTTTTETHSSVQIQNTQTMNDALAEVNAARARRGLRPFMQDHGLTIGAQRVAQFRASRGISGHVSGGMGDFGFLPPGAHASAGGCAAWPQGMGWGSCCTYDTQYTYAGAAYAIGQDGKRYMHLFVR